VTAARQRPAAWLRVVIALSLLAGAGVSHPEAGPMIGHVTTGSAELWAYDPRAESMTLHWKPEDGRSSVRNEVRVEPVSGKVFRHRMTGLRADTGYVYQVETGGREPVHGSFRTPPPEGQPCRFSYVLTSCMDVKGFPKQPAWDEALRQRPAFHLLVGDNVYADSTDYGTLVALHLRQRTVPNFAKLLANVPTYATWDDHDFGPNDSHAGTPGKGNSLRAFKDLWANPSYGTPDTPGVFFSFRWGDVEFFVLDDRYHRTDERAPNGPDKTQFGPAQLDWLFDGLAKSKATFKIIATGYDVMSTRYPDELRKLAERIRESRVDGVIFNAGDIHRTEFKQQDHGMGYPVTQITSSGIARNPTRPWAVIDIDTRLADPTVTARFFAEEALQETHRVRLSELRHAASE
jgi:alkaline phosphatase D